METKSVGVGSRFLDEVEQAVSMLTDLNSLRQPLSPRRRACRLAMARGEAHVRGFTRQRLGPCPASQLSTRPWPGRGVVKANALLVGQCGRANRSLPETPGEAAHNWQSTGG